MQARAGDAGAKAASVHNAMSAQGQLQFGMPPTPKRVLVARCLFPLSLS